MSHLALLLFDIDSGLFLAGIHNVEDRRYLGFIFENEA